ncbi:MAG: class I SAM-dependent methyltransferase [Cellvibrionales bacterium]|nr:class I SAM-dependent methyltransferase [Cellvibrionales bacterium]
MEKGLLDQYADVKNYVLKHSLRQDDLLKELQDLTQNMPEKSMQIPPEQGQFLSMLIQLTAAKKVIEIGVFTGYSSLCMARSLPADGKIIGLDVSEEWTNIAKTYWQRAGVSDKIDLRLAPAIESLDTMIANNETETVDLIFLDADKEKYLTYYERSLSLLKSGGLLVIDNVLLFGSVVKHDRLEDDMPSKLSKASIIEVDALNKKIVDDDRVDLTMLTMADGISLVRKK